MRPGHVYVICEEVGPVKIGITGDHKKRFSAIQAASGRVIARSWVSPVVGKPRNIEYRLHCHFASQRVAGEWFDIGFDVAVAAAASLMEAELLSAGTPTTRYQRGLEVRSVLHHLHDSGRLDDSAAIGFMAALSDSDVDAVACSIAADAQAWERLAAELAGVVSRHGLDGRGIVLAAVRQSFSPV